ncbi:MAG: hydroxymethylbilane synthase [Polyangiaceae bacterium]
MLALAQARAWVSSLIALHPGLTVDELLVVTTGDRITDRPLQEVGGKGLFLKEIEEALVAKEADLAVHSIKDVPADLAAGLVLAAIPVREDPRDALVSRDGAGLMSLKPGAVIGTSSLRRSLLLRRARPDISCIPLRGNVDTRLRKLEAGECDAIVLAAAGLRRLGMIDRATELLDPSVSIPAVGQGALGIECRADDPRTFEIARATHHTETALAVSLERGFMRAVEGSCQVPIAAHASRSGDTLRVLAMLAEPDGSRPRFLDRTLSAPSTEADAQALGEQLGKELRAS